MPATRHMISTPEFEAMKKKPIIVNTSRGGLVDEAAMVDALDRDLISGIGFDVLTSEPPKPDNPLLAVLERPNVIVTPHVAWYTKEAAERLEQETLQRILEILKGIIPQNLKNPEVLEPE